MKEFKWILSFILCFVITLQANKPGKKLSLNTKIFDSESIESIGKIVTDVVDLALITEGETVTEDASSENVTYVYDDFSTTEDVALEEDIDQKDNVSWTCSMEACYHEKLHLNKYYINQTKTMLVFAIFIALQIDCDDEVLEDMNIDPYLFFFSSVKGDPVLYNLFYNLNYLDLVVNDKICLWYRRFFRSLFYMQFKVFKMFNAIGCVSMPGNNEAEYEDYKTFMEKVLHHQKRNNKFSTMAVNYGDLDSLIALNRKALFKLLEFFKNYPMPPKHYVILLKKLSDLKKSGRSPKREEMFFREKTCFFDLWYKAFLKEAKLFSWFSESFKAVNTKNFMSLLDWFKDSARKVDSSKEIFSQIHSRVAISTEKQFATQDDESEEFDSFIRDVKGISLNEVL